MKTKQVSTSALNDTTDVTIIVSNYNNNNNLYVGLIDNVTGEDYNDITTNIMPLSGNFGYILSSDTETIDFITEQCLAVSTGIEYTFNHNTYILYQFNIDSGFAAV